jgi:hypothetical protein
MRCRRTPSRLEINHTCGLVGAAENVELMLTECGRCRSPGFLARGRPNEEIRSSILASVVTADFYRSLRPYSADVTSALDSL